MPKFSLEYRNDKTACVCEPFLLGGDDLNTPIKTQFDRKMRRCYDAYRAVWLAKSKRELIAQAEEIAIVKQIMQNLSEIQDEDAMTYLLTFQNPLQIIADYWQSALEFNLPMRGSQLQSVLWHINDTHDADGEYEKEQDFASKESGSPALQ